MMVKRKQKIGLIGECMVQLQANVDGSIETSFAGDTLNTATYLARLVTLHEAQVDYITALGNDDFSQKMISQFKQDGICCDQIRILDNKLPGLYYVNIDANGERSFLYWRGEAAAKDLFKPTTVPSIESLAGYDFLYISGISLAILDTDSKFRLLALLEDARSQGTKICFDNNYRPKLWESSEQTQKWYRQILKITDFAFLTFEDEQLLWGDVSTEQTLSRYSNLNIPNIIIKCGADPCHITSETFTGSVEALQIPKSKVIDTNAAGDSFSAGYLCGVIAQFESPRECAELAHQVAGTVIQNRGAIIDSTATSELVSKLLKERQV